MDFTRPVPADIDKFLQSMRFFKLIVPYYNITDKLTICR